MTVLLAYLRDGHVYADHEAWEHGLDHAPYEIVCEDPPYARTRIAGVNYVSEWLWGLDAKRQYGAVKLIEVSAHHGK
ncbi:hypothetical protein [Sphingomonas sp. 3-13AW]|uniref:hypothetical protein n=1 Tax=Sphingomonas sp. 3-13AW TaxID=3050450 RepID=UPI003BB635BE